jgi:hypothetical protein
VEEEPVAESVASHQSISRQTKDPFFKSINKAERLLFPGTVLQSPLDKVLPNTLDSQNEIVLHGCKPHSQRPFDRNGTLAQCDLDARWRVDAHRSSPRRPSRQLKELDQNSSPNCRSIMKYQSFPESPSRRTRTLNSSTENFSILVQCDAAGINKPRICMQPNAGKNQASKASPLRRHSPVKPGSSSTHQRRRSNSIDDLIQRQVDGQWHTAEHHLPGQRVDTKPSAASNNCSPIKALKHCAVDNSKDHFTSEDDESGHRHVEPAFLVKKASASDAVHKILAKRSCDNNKRFL